MRWSHLVALGVAGSVTTGVACAQSAGCAEPDRPSIGVGVGRSSPYFDLDAEAIAEPPSGSISVRNGNQISGRGDVSIAGPFRFRVEASAAHWNVEVQTYSGPPNVQLVSTRSAGEIAARHLGASIGVRTGRWPTCAYVLAGGGLYSMTFRGSTLRRPGVVLTAGIEIPTGDHGRVQADVQLHLIDTQSRPPISSTTALAATLVGGWAYKF